jgi:uncharacterized protein
MKTISGLVLILAMIFMLGLGGMSCNSSSASDPATTPDSTTATQVPYETLVENLIKNSAAYRFDGIDGSLKITNITGSAKGDDPGPVADWMFNAEFQTAHPGHGNRADQVLAQVITAHKAVVIIEDGQIISATCDENWDLLTDKEIKTMVSGIVLDGGGTTAPDRPQDVPRLFVYRVRMEDGSVINVAYTAYPPSPAGDAARAKITLEIDGGVIKAGDEIEAMGELNRESNTLTVAAEGDYLRTQAQSLSNGNPGEFRTVSEEVGWEMGDTSVTATVTRPDDNGPHAAIVFIAGSGPTDRDWNSPLLPGTNGSAKLLAEELAKAGFVTIRYDKRVTGPNALKNLPFLTGKISMESHADEVAGAVDVLLKRPEVDPAKIFVLANSEGTIHALNYQIGREPKFAGLVLTGLPGRNMAAVTRGQIEAQVAALPEGKSIMEGYDKLMADFLAEKPFTPDPAVPEGLNNLFQGFNNPLNLPFARELFKTDASLLLASIDTPVLVVIGQKDIQVDFQRDGEVLEAAVKGQPQVTFAYPENANHVLKLEKRPRSALSAVDALTYNASDRVLDPAALELIKEWLNNAAR